MLFVGILVNKEITHSSRQSPLSYKYSQKSLTFCLEVFVLPIIHTKCQFTCQVALQVFHLYLPPVGYIKWWRFSESWHIFNFPLMEFLPHGLKQYTDYGICIAEKVKCFKIKFHGFPIENLYHRRWKTAHFILKQLLIGPFCLKTVFTIQFHTVKSI